MGQKNSSKRHRPTPFQILMNAIFEATELSGFLYLWLQNSHFSTSILWFVPCNTPVQSLHSIKQPLAKKLPRSILFVLGTGEQHSTHLWYLRSAHLQHRTILAHRAEISLSWGGAECREQPGLIACSRCALLCAVRPA